MTLAHHQVAERVVDAGVLGDVLSEGAGVGNSSSDPFVGRIREVVVHLFQRGHAAAVGPGDVGESGGYRERRQAARLALDVDELGHPVLEIA